MKTTLAIVLALALAGCSTTVPVKRNFPDAPPSLMEPVEPLKTVDPKDPKFSKIIETSIDNMGAYHALAEKYRAWQEWYKSQKKIFDEVK